MNKRIQRLSMEEALLKAQEFKEAVEWGKTLMLACGYQRPLIYDSGCAAWGFYYGSGAEFVTTPEFLKAHNFHRSRKKITYQK